MKKVQDITGFKFGRLTVISKSDEKKKQSYWDCLCDCGTKRTVRGHSLTTGKTVSCGCYREEMKKNIKRKHGMFGTKFYGSWSAMVQRCSDINHPYYKNYGGRGITVCNDWLHFENFQNDMFPSYEEGLMLDRINNEDGYHKDNCRWATRKEQANNMRTNRIVTVDGKEMTLSQACDYKGIKYSVVRSRLYRGWDLEKALNTNVNRRVFS